MGVPWHGGRDHEDEFVAFYEARADQIRKTAYLLCGDWHLAEDLTQTTFTKLYRSWRRIERRDTLDQYARRVVLRAFLDERRRPWRRERSAPPGTSEWESVAPGEFHDERIVLHTALLKVPKRQRAVLVLRFWSDLSVGQVADILGCSEGTVKSQTADGLANLRNVLHRDLNDLREPSRGGTR